MGGMGDPMGGAPAGGPPGMGGPPGGDPMGMGGPPMGGPPAPSGPKPQPIPQHADVWTVLDSIMKHKPIEQEAKLEKYKSQKSQIAAQTPDPMGGPPPGMGSGGDPMMGGPPPSMPQGGALLS